MVPDAKRESLPAAWAPRTKGAASAVVASAAVLSTVRRVGTASPISTSLQSCRVASRLVGSSFGGLRSPVWSVPQYGRCTFPRGQYRTTRPPLPILHPSGVHSRHGADHVVTRSNRSIDLRIRPREYVGLRIRKLWSRWGANLPLRLTSALHCPLSRPNGLAIGLAGSGLWAECAFRHAAGDLQFAHDDMMIRSAPQRSRYCTSSSE